MPPTLQFAADPFTLGIASGYPEPNAIVLWTRLAPEPLVPGGGMPAAPVEVAWEIGTDERLRKVARRGTTFATPDWAHSVHVEVTGLMPGRDYWYRFTSGGRQSADRPHAHGSGAAHDAGPLHARSRVVPALRAKLLRGLSRRRRRRARSRRSSSATTSTKIAARRRLRTHDQPECYTLDDYRRRYALYKSDPDLKAAHAAAPWLLVADDHEVANDYAGELSYQGDPRDVFLARRAAAYQAWYEHQPFPRGFMPVAGQQRSYTSRSFGDLVTVLMLDGRQYRSPHACEPVPLVEPCPELYLGQRTMLGDAQEQWLATALGASTARWTLFGQQTLFAHFDQSGDGPLVY